jgi:hypothetical protein
LFAKFLQFQRFDYNTINDLKLQLRDATYLQLISKATCPFLVGMSERVLNCVGNGHSEGRAGEPGPDCFEVGCRHSAAAPPRSVFNLKFSASGGVVPRWDGLVQSS